MPYCDECLDNNPPYSERGLCRGCQERRDEKLAKQNALDTTGQDLIAALMQLIIAAGIEMTREPKPYPSEVLTDICKMLMDDWELPLREVENLAIDLPGEYEAHIQARNARQP